VEIRMALEKTSVIMTILIAMLAMSGGNVSAAVPTGASEVDGSGCPSCFLPIAEFTSDIRYGNAPLTVQFFDQSINSPTSWAWDFQNDGIRDSQSKNPAFTYPEPGTYSVKLTATNGQGSDTEIKYRYITVFPKPTITVVSPNGGEDWPRGTYQIIRWEYTGYPGTTVRIELLNGSTLFGIVTPGTPVGTDGTGSLIVPVPPDMPLGTEYRVRVNSTRYPSVGDTSDATFSISVVPSITVATPGGGEDWVQGSLQTIRWNYTSDPGPSVKIELLKGTAVRVVHPNMDIGSGGSGSFPVTVPYSLPPGNDYMIRVTSTRCPTCIDTSDTPFTISPAITMISPDGGEAWLQGSSQTIRWSYTSNPGSMVKIEVLRSGTLLKTISSSYPIGLNGTGSLDLTVPFSTPLGDDYTIRITSTSYPACTDTSDAPFTIVPALTVVTPDGGEDWFQGSLHTIWWSYSGNPGSTVKIEALRSGTLLKTLSSSCPIGLNGTGSLDLTIPFSTPLGDDYTIRVTSTSYPACTDTSDAPFTIVPAPIDASESGPYIVPIPSSTPLGSDYWIRVTSTSYPACTDVSNGTFAISDA